MKNSYLLHWKKDEKGKVIKELYDVFEKVNASESEFVKLVKNLLINFWSTTPIPSILGTIFYQCELMMEIFPPHFEAYYKRGSLVWKKVNLDTG